MSRRTKENSQEAILNKLLSEPGNDVCADCGARSPRWASVTLGVFLCIRCAGIHRQIGVHVTLVKSVNLDTWKPEQIQKCIAVGNLKAAQIYEANVPAGARPNPNDQYAVEQWIRAKYERKLYMAAAGAGPSPSPSPSPSAAAREKREERYGRSVTVSQSPSPTSRRLASSTTTTATLAATAPHSAPVHRRSSSTATTAAAPSPAPTVDFFSLESTVPPTPSTTPTPTLTTQHHHQRTPSLPMHLDSYSMPNLSLFSSMTATPSPPLHHQPHSPAAVAVAAPPHSPAAPPADLFAGLSLGSAPTSSPLPAAADAGRSYDSAKADIMQLFQPAPQAQAFYQSPAVLPSPHMAMQHPGTPYVYHQAQPFGYPAVATTGQFYSGLH